MPDGTYGGVRGRGLITPSYSIIKSFHQNSSFSIAYSEKEGGVGMSGFFGGGKSGGFGTLFLLLIIIIIFFSAGVDDF
jgi:hypothetical protein